MCKIVYSSTLIIYKTRITCFVRLSIILIFSLVNSFCVCVIIIIIAINIIYLFSSKRVGKCINQSKLGW